LTVSLPTYTFVNTPYNVPASSYTASVSSVLLYGKKAAKPVIFDSPFPLRRRDIVEDISELPAFYDPCSWVLYSSKIGTLGYSAKYNYAPIQHVNVLTSTNYRDL